VNFNWTNPYPSIRTPVFARNIVSTSQPLAAQAGLRILHNGGNAVDAAIAAAAGITLTEPLRVNRQGERRFAVTGTPTDCVVIAVNDLMPERPDLVLSGVNRGHNVGEDCSYSGTVAGALQGMAFGIRSIANASARPIQPPFSPLAFSSSATRSRRAQMPAIRSSIAMPPGAPFMAGGSSW
jgi:5'/3'-nucleotidase SurE